MSPRDLARWSVPAPWALGLLAALAACETERPPAGKPAAGPVPATAPAPVDPEAGFTRDRARMVETQLRGRDITDPAVLEAMGKVPRHRFVPPAYRGAAYADQALPIGMDQTISQPYIVALMTQLARPASGSRVLEVGTGSGYQAAVLAEMGAEVYSVEILCPLADAARVRLGDLGFGRVSVLCGDGYRGWSDHAPFDAILVTAAPPRIPEPLLHQLAPGGRLVVPVGAAWQELLLIERRLDGSFDRRSVLPVLFVPMTGEAQGR